MTTDNLRHYRNCMASSLSDLGSLSPTEKKVHFAMSAKLCSQKASTPEEAYVFIRKDHPDWFTDDSKEYKGIFKRFGIEKE